jgi:hypothetical protein
MPCLVPIVEGDGDVQAVPVLLRRFVNHYQWWHWSIGRPIKTGSLAKLKQTLPSYLRLALKQQDCGAILILLDLDDGCPATEAHALAANVRIVNSLVPVAIVFAHREYETWFLASIETIVGHRDVPSVLTYPGPVEAPRGAKERLREYLPPGRGYKETTDQAKFTHLIDLNLARERSRSFRRLDAALRELIQFAEHEEIGQVSPLMRP